MDEDKSGSSGNGKDENDESRDDDLVHVFPLGEPSFDDHAEQSLSRLDEALQTAADADSRSEALAALTRATAEINTFFVNPGLSAPVSASIAGGRTFQAMTILPWKKDKSEDTERKWEERVQKYWKVVDQLVEKFGPDQFQISVGFPQVVSVTLTWNVKKTTP